MNDTRPRVLVFVGFYLPGFKAGGPIQSAANLIDHLGDDIHFHVVTSDRDLGATEPYDGVQSNTWLQVGKASVMYLPYGFSRIKAIWRILRNNNYDLIYLNSFFSPWFSLLPLSLRRLRLVPRVPLILSPRGELANGALGLKRLKKVVHIAISKLTGLYEGISWHSTSAHEESDIRRVLGSPVSVITLPNLTALAKDEVQRERCKEAGKLRAIFLSRISKTKNLAWAITQLSRVRGDIEYHIYGPCEDVEYWKECERAMATLPPTIRVVYHGPVEHHQVRQVLAQFDLFYVPTLGENFGHAILEALTAGCPVLVSDRTPWRDLSVKSAGWDLALEYPDQFTSALQTMTDMDEASWRMWSNGARQLASSSLAASSATQSDYRQMILSHLLAEPADSTSTKVG